MSNAILRARDELRRRVPEDVVELIFTFVDWVLGEVQGSWLLSESAARDWTDANRWAVWGRRVVAVKSMVSLSGSSLQGSSMPGSYDVAVWDFGWNGPRLRSFWCFAPWQGTLEHVVALKDAIWWFVRLYQSLFVIITNYEGASRHGRWLLGPTISDRPESIAMTEGLLVRVGGERVWCYDVVGGHGDPPRVVLRWTSNSGAYGARVLVTRAHVIIYSVNMGVYYRDLATGRWVRYQAWGLDEVESWAVGASAVYVVRSRARPNRQGLVPVRPRVIRVYDPSHHRKYEFELPAMLGQDRPSSLHLLLVGRDLLVFHASGRVMQVR